MNGRPVKDKLLIGIPALVSGGVVLTTKMGATLVLLGSLLGFWLGVSSEPVTLDRTAVLALMAGLASGAERVYLNEEGVTISDLQTDVDNLVSGFRSGKRLGLMIRNERANPCYDTQFMVSLFEEEGGRLFDVRQAILGHLQQGGDPTPFDRNLATRLAKRCVERLIDEAEAGSDAALAIGLEDGTIGFSELETLRRQVDTEFQRPKNQWWMDLRPIARVLAQPGPTGHVKSGE